MKRSGSRGVGKPAHRWDQATPVRLVQTSYGPMIVSGRWDAGAAWHRQSDACPVLSSPMPHAWTESDLAFVVAAINEKIERERAAPIKSPADASDGPSPVETGSLFGSQA